MIVTSIILPHWVSYSVTATDGNEFSKHIGLHKICSNVGPGPACKVFPTDELCSKDGERYFCSMWRSVGFLASFSTIMHLASLVTFLVIMSGGKYKRETGWKILGGLLIFVAAIEFTLMGIVVSLSQLGDDMARGNEADEYTRRTSSTMTSSSASLAGVSTHRGFSAPSAHPSLFFALWDWAFPHLFSHRRRATSSSTTRCRNP